MARLALEDFSDKEIVRIYIAQNMREAERIERVLSENGIDYAVELEPFLKVIFLPSQYVGAAFYVVSNQADFCRTVLESAGLSAGFVE